MRAVIALGAGILAVAAFSAGPATPSAERAERCRATLVYHGVTYYGLEASHLGLRAGRAAGIGLEPECADVPLPCRPGEPCNPPKYRRVAVRRIAGVRLRVAVARRDVPKIIYVASDRCRTALGTATLVRCLRRSR